jgi:hypothetical protein
MQTLKEPQIGENQSGILPAKIPTDLLIGYVLLAFSFLGFAITEIVTAEGKENVFTIFVFHYLTALSYTGVLIFHKSFGIVRSWKKENISKTIVSILLYLVSAYALNRELPVFQDSTNWLCAYLISTAVILLSFHFQNRLPSWATPVQYIILGSAFVFYSYLVLYVAHYYVVGFIGIIFLGIGGHIFVPVTLLIAMIALARHTCKRKDVFGWELARWRLFFIVFRSWPSGTIAFSALIRSCGNLLCTRTQPFPYGFAWAQRCPTIGLPSGY